MGLDIYALLLYPSPNADRTCRARRALHGSAAALVVRILIITRDGTRIAWLVRNTDGQVDKHHWLVVDLPLWKILII